MALFAFTAQFNEVLDRWDGSIGAPSAENRKLDRIRVYENGFVEHVLASSHPILPGVWFGGFVGYGLYSAITGELGLATGLATYLGGAVGFSLIEYLLHRFVFHFKPNDSRASRIWLFLAHGLHHEFPNDKLRLVAPPLMSWPIALVIFGLYAAVVSAFGLPRDVLWVLFGGTTLGYLAYDWTHYATHHFRSSRNRVFKLVRRAHAVHHYKLFHLNMGISSPLWDFVFGTFAWSEDTVRAAMAEARVVEDMTDRAEREKANAEKPASALG